MIKFIIIIIIKRCSAKSPHKITYLSLILDPGVWSVLTFHVCM